MKLNARQQVFVTEYLKDYNATQAAIRAGYSERTARSQGQRLLTNVDIKNEIEKMRVEIQNENISTAKDIEEFLSKSMRGEIDEEVILTVGVGDGFSEVRSVRKEISAKDRIKAAEMLGKRYAMWTDKQQIEGNAVVTFVDDIGDGNEA